VAAINQEIFLEKCPVCLVDFAILKVERKFLGAALVAAPFLLGVILKTESNQASKLECAKGN